MAHQEYLINVDLLGLLEDAVEQVVFNDLVQNIFCLFCAHLQVFIPILIE